MVFTRLGGEEFAAFLPGLQAQSAFETAEDKHACFRNYQHPKFSPFGPLPVMVPRGRYDARLNRIPTGEAYGGCQTVGRSAAVPALANLQADVDDDDVDHPSHDGCGALFRLADACLVADSYRYGA